PGHHQPAAGTLGWCGPRQNHGAGADHSVHSKAATRAIPAERPGGGGLEVSRLANSLIHCALRPSGASEPLDSGVAAPRFGTTKPSPLRLALKRLRGSVNQIISQKGHRYVAI